MHEITEFVRVVAWPFTTLVIFLILRGELQRFTKNVADRIQSANSISIGPRGFELQGLVKVTPLLPEVQARKVAFTRLVRGLTSKSMSDEIADMLSVPRSTDTRARRNDIIIEVNRRVETKQGMDTLSANAKPITGIDFSSMNISGPKQKKMV
jgi:hypothetical protein